MHKKLEIPFIKSRGWECGQACVSMIIKYYYPDFEPDFDEFNKIIHHTPGKYTFPLQDAILLDHYGVKAKCFSSEGIPTTNEDPDVFKRWYKEEWEYQKQFIDLDTYNWMVKTGREKNLFEQKNTTFDEILELVIQGNLVTTVIDWNILIGKKDNYQGHAIVISGIEGDDILIHDPDLEPYMKYSKEKLKDAYEHPIIADDLTVAYGKKN